MSLADLRDLVIIIWGVAGIVLLVMLMVLAFLIFRKVREILDAANKTAAQIQGTVSLLTDCVAGPLVKTASFTVGLRKGFEALSKLRRRRKEGGSV